jgi:CRISPR locus-related DNA-binding protein
MKKILISPIYDNESIMICATKLSIDKIFLLIDKVPNEKQKKSINLIKNSLGKVVEIVEKKIEVYDILETAKLSVKILDSIPEGHEVYINITPGRKTQGLGLSYGAYARSEKVNAILYVTEEKKEMIYLPKLSYDLTSTQRQMLELIKLKEFQSVSNISEKLDSSTSITYRNYQTLLSKGMILKTKEGVKLTDFGKLALL